MARARSLHSPTSVACSLTKAAPSRSIAGAPARPFASAITVSLVDMSPSTVMVLNVSSTASASAACSTAGATVASVVMKQSIVAIWGWIIPEPLAIAANLTALPPMSISRNATFVRRSVVRIASAAGMASSPSAATSAGTAAAIRSTGSGMPMAAGRRRQHGVRLDAQALRDRLRDGPLVVRRRAARRSRSRCRCWRRSRGCRSPGSRPAPKSTGAARMRLTVNDPAAAQGASEHDQRDVAARRPGLLDARRRRRRSGTRSER